MHCGILINMPYLLIINAIFLSALSQTRPGIRSRQVREDKRWNSDEVYRGDWHHHRYEIL